MTPAAWGQLALFSALVLLTTRPLGAYMARVFEGERRPLPRVLGPVERFLFRLSGVDPSIEQAWVGYTVSLLAFSLFGLLVTYAVLLLQHVLPLNRQKRACLDPGRDVNSPDSITTNPNWQGYGGESTMTFLSHMAGLPCPNSVPAGAGIATAIALARGFPRRQAPDAPRTLG